MLPKMLEDLVEIGKRYLSIEHPKLDISEEEFGAKIMLLYVQVLSEIKDLDAKIIRHRVSTSLGDFDLMMEVERIGLHSGFCVHIDQDQHLIASWAEGKTQVD